MDPDTNRKIYNSDNEGWAENRKKKLHDPLNLRKEPNKDVPESSKPKVAKIPPKKGRRATPVIFRPTLLRPLKYKIKKIPTHAIRFGVHFNNNFLEDFQKSIGELLNKATNVLHIRHANGGILKFCINEVAIITSLKVKGNKDFEYPKSTPYGRYRDYPWGQISFSKLIISLRQYFNLSKQLYRLYGMPYALNVWIYESAFQLNLEIAVIPRMCNWRVVADKAKF
ncbi:hypothetical protein H5410_039307 [Solanum commersonii]|uniref:Uncharacterized protein n=1 Tax=Solanum commersonii TaxID=4109 RepID=A0A9J5YBI2_SOLCO|nr:hypothetical protein H5410_039307 [Solanum commersonii]